MDLELVRVDHPGIHVGACHRAALLPRWRAAKAGRLAGSAPSKPPCGAMRRTPARPQVLPPVPQALFFSPTNASRWPSTREGRQHFLLACELFENTVHRPSQLLPHP